jgi:hypothetical protein
MSFFRSLALSAAAAAALGAAVVIGGAPVSAQPADVSSFLAAAALQPGDVPSGMMVESQGPLDPNETAQLAGALGDASGGSDLLGGYVQGLVATDITTALFGQPALGGTGIFAFNSIGAASAWQAALVADAANGAQTIQQLLSGSSDTAANITINNVVPLSPPSVGDDAQEYELTGSLGFGGQSFNVTIDVVVARRGAVQFETIAGGLQQERGVAEAMASSVDTNIQANLTQLSGS